MVYVGSANDNKKDQELERIDVGPIEVGTMRFTVKSDTAVDFADVPLMDIEDTTVLLIEFWYREQKFCTAGFYLTNVPPEDLPEYTAEQQHGTAGFYLTNVPPEDLPENTAEQQHGPVYPELSLNEMVGRLTRVVFCNEPTIRHFPILWNPPTEDEAEKN